MDHTAAYKQSAREPLEQNKKAGNESSKLCRGPEQGTYDRSNIL
jgi:hypothetical protein